jgi:CubicO group peptidase (beta-lactamase class C family)
MVTSRALLAAAVAPLLLAAGPYPGSKDWAGVAQIGGGVSAQLACAGVFVAGRDPADVERDDVHGMNPLLGGAKIQVDTVAKTVSAVALPGTPAVTSFWRPGVGCTLAQGAPPAAPALGLPGVPELTYGNRPGAFPAGDGPQVAAPRGGSRAALDAAVQAMFDDLNAKGPETRAVVVVQDGRLVAERYAPGFDAKTRLLGWSMSKTVTGALIGALVDDGKLTLDAPAPVPAWSDPANPRHAITLRHLLQMTNGLAFTDEVVPGDESTMLFGRPDMAAYAAERPVVAPPGTLWSYSTGSSVILSKIATDTLGGPVQVQTFLRRRIFLPSGMRSAVVEVDGVGTPVGGSYVYATARDWARFGLVWLNGGKAPGGRRVISPDWVRFSTTSSGLAPKNGYGAQVWLNAGDGPDPAQRRWPHLPRDAYFMLGHNMQLVAVIPSRHVVIVRLGWTPDGQGFDSDRYFSKVLDALG